MVPKVERTLQAPLYNIYCICDMMQWRSGGSVVVVWCVYRDGADDWWMADDEAPPPYIEPLSHYGRERRLVDVDELTSHQRHRSYTNQTKNLSVNFCCLTL